MIESLSDDDKPAAPAGKRQSIDEAICLLDQQAWCWGRDVLRTAGNWLVQLGFQRLKPPASRSKCASVYSLELPQDRCVVLRGFGVFYGDRKHGGVFLPRYEFQPCFTEQAVLEQPPWSGDDLPPLGPPTQAQRHACATLTLGLIDWIREYEVTVTQCLGTDYRRETLVEWDNGERCCIPAEQFASAWRELSFQVAANFDAFLGRDPA